MKFRSEVIVPAALRSGYWRGEVRLQTGQGTEIPVWQTMVAHRDRDGELKLLTSILRDLREQKTVESRLRESGDRAAQSEFTVGGPGRTCVAGGPLILIHQWYDR